MVVSINSRGTLTLPSNIRKELELKDGDHFDIEVKLGKIIITPLILVPKTQLSLKGKEKEKEASKEVKDKKIKTFSTSKELIEELNED